MKKKVFYALTSTILANSLFATALNEKDLNDFKKMEIFNNKEVVLIGGETISSEFAMIKGYMVTHNEANPYSPINIVTNKEIIMPNADVFNSKTKQLLSVDVDYSKFEKYSTFKFGNGKEKLMLFTEAECPACKQSHPYLEQLKENYTVYVYMFPLNSIHLVAKDIALATLQQPVEKREEFYNKMIVNQDVISVLSELENYSVEIYKNIKQRIEKFENPGEQQITQKYIEKIKRAYNVDFKTKQELVDFCDAKIKKFNDKNGNKKSYKDAVEQFKQNEFLALAYLGVDGTPNFFYYNGQKTELGQLLGR